MGKDVSLRERRGGRAVGLHGMAGEATSQDKNLMIIDCQPNIHEFIQDHIPGALYAHENLFRIHDGAIPTRWIAADAAEILFRTLGLEPEQPVVVYSSSGPLTTCGIFIGDGLEQTMLAYTLARFGHRNVYVLDGGLEKWKEEKRPVTRQFDRGKTVLFHGEPPEGFLRGLPRVPAAQGQARHGSPGCPALAGL